MFDKILEKLNKLNEEEFDFEDIEIEQASEPISLKHISDLDVRSNDEYPMWYALYRKSVHYSGTLGLEEFVSKLQNENQNILADAFMIGSFNYQVNNGGFDQWVFNGYAFTLHDLIVILDKIDTQISQMVSNMLSNLSQHIDFERNSWNSDFTDYDDYGEQVGEEKENKLDLLDDRYYDINDRFCADVENYFRERVEREGIAESVVDFPQTELENSIWNKQDSLYTINEEAKNKIFDTLSKYKEFDLYENAEAIHITGSIGTNLYKEETDIDVHIVLKDDIEFSEEQQKAVFSWFKKNRDEIDGYIDSHPIEVYVQLNPDQELLSDAVYDILSDTWIIGPTIFPPDYDPYEKYEHILSDVKAEALHADELIGELRRDTIDYTAIRDAVANMSIGEKSNLLDRLQSKLQEIEDGIEKLKSTKQSWIDARKSSSQPESGEQALSDIELARKWNDKNAEFKFLDRYNYMRLIKDLEIMVEDDKISDTEVDIIKGLL